MESDTLKNNAENPAAQWQKFEDSDSEHVLESQSLNLKHMRAELCWANTQVLRCDTWNGVIQEAKLAWGRLVSKGPQICDYTFWRKTLHHHIVIPD